MRKYSAGKVTAYGAAKAGGYTGTYEEFCAALGALANVLEDLENFTVEITTLPAGEPATASYEDGVLSLGIPKGDKGDTGATGNGIASITMTGTSGLVDTYTILYTDGTSTTFTVTNGEKGDKGDKGDTGATGNGIASITLTSTSGAVKTYTILYTDGTSTTFDVTDGEVTNAVLEETIENFAEGVHEDMTSGNTEVLLSDVYTDNSEPYLFRKTGGSDKVGSREYLDKIVGGSLVVNQLTKSNANSVTYNGVTYTNNGDGSWDISGTATANSTFNFDTSGYSLVANHKYLVTGCPAGGGSGKYYVGIGGLNIDSGNGYIWNNSAGYTSGRTSMQIVNGVSVDFKNVKPQVIDLTAEFGSTIADYVYGLGQADGIAWLRQYIDIDSYHPYSAPTLKHVEGLTSHDTIGFNLFDKATATGGIINSNGTISASSAYSVSDFIPVLPNTDYYFKDILSAYYAYPIAFYDANKNFISMGSVGAGQVAAVSGIKATPNNAHYMRVGMRPAYVEFVCINLSEPQKNGTYEPYQKHSYPLDPSVVLRGYPTLVGGRLKFDGDEYLYNGTIKRNYRIVDLGTLNWQAVDTSTAGYHRFSAALAYYAEGIPSTTVGKIVCTKYIAASGDDLYLRRKDGISYSVNGSTIVVYDQAYEQSSAADFKASVSGVYAVYKALTPTTEQVEPFRQLQICDTYGTESFVTTSEIPVGTETRYPEDLKAKVEGLPWDLSMIAPIEDGTTASQAYTAGQYFLHNNVFCKALTSIASVATFTLNTNYTETTVAAELYAALH